MGSGKVGPGSGRRPLVGRRPSLAVGRRGVTVAPGLCVSAGAGVASAAAALRRDSQGQPPGQQGAHPVLALKAGQDRGVDGVVDVAGIERGEARTERHAIPGDGALGVDVPEHHRAACRPRRRPPRPPGASRPRLARRAGRPRARAPGYRRRCRCRCPRGAPARSACSASSSTPLMMRASSWMWMPGPRSGKTACSSVWAATAGARRSSSEQLDEQPAERGKAGRRAHRAKAAFPPSSASVAFPPSCRPGALRRAPGRRPARAARAVLSGSVARTRRTSSADCS